jgi:hypothetical protein
MDSSAVPGQNLHLHYTSPAKEWAEALPLGNGRLGCMVYGRTSTELIQLNEDSVWYGGPQDRTPRDASRHLPLLRQLIRDGRHAEAERLVKASFFATPASMRHYEPAGTCTFEFEHDDTDALFYERHLDLSSSQMTVSYRYENVTIRRDAIASFPDHVLVFRIAASRPIRFTIRLNRVSEVEWETNEFLDSIEASDGRIAMHATPGGKDSNKLCVVLGARCDDFGLINTIGNSIVVTSSLCTVVIAAQTTYRATDPQQAAMANVSAALGRPWEELVKRHATDYRSLFNRETLQMWPDNCHRPTDERIRSARDPGLVALYHNYGRYLLISSSRNGESALPANLQGIWNPSFAPPWGSKYTININLQMNYWPAAPANLMECTLPLVSLLERMAVRGRITAEKMYGCRGWCAHHNTDIWADTNPQDRWMPSTLWPLGGVWLCIDIVEMLQYRYDAEIHATIAPILQGCVEFLLDFLVPSADGVYLVTNPSLSPENTFISDSGEPGIFCEGSAIDMTIVRIAFDRFIWSTDIIDIRHPLRGKVLEAISRLPDLVVNKNGLIQEWGMNNYKEKEPGHRHVSHLFGLYPGNTFVSATSVDLCEAAQRVLERRAAHGGGHTGWSRAWLLNLHARLADPEGCVKHMDLLLEKSTLPNMLDNHPPFQIDGNFGGTAGILECLIQSSEMSRTIKPYRVMIRLLPSCPKEWPNGKVSGVCVKGGWSVSFEWVNGEIIDPIFLKATQVETLKAHIIYPGGDMIVWESKGFGEHEIRREETDWFPMDRGLL